MMIAVIVLLVILVLLAVEEIRARREHEALHEVLHAEIAELSDQVEKFESKFDGGINPK